MGGCIIIIIIIIIQEYVKRNIMTMQTARARDRTEIQNYKNTK